MKDEELKDNSFPEKEVEKKTHDKTKKPTAENGKKSFTKKSERKDKAPKENKSPAIGSRKSARIGDKRAVSKAEGDEAEDKTITEEQKMKRASSKK